jgi:hypothetical protein
VQTHWFAPARVKHEPLVPAPVADALSAVQRLVKVADEVHDELQRLHTFLPWLGPIREHLRLPIDGVDEGESSAMVMRWNLAPTFASFA